MTLINVIEIATIIPVFHQNRLLPRGISERMYFSLLFNKKKPIYATGNKINAMADVGIAIQVPILLQSIAPKNPGTGTNVANLYFQPVSGNLNISQIAKPQTTI